jgi:hypothetical protein
MLLLGYTFFDEISMFMILVLLSQVSNKHVQERKQIGLYKVLNCGDITENRS